MNLTQRLGKIAILGQPPRKNHRMSDGRIAINSMPYGLHTFKPLTACENKDEGV